MAKSMSLKEAVTATAQQKAEAARARSAATPAVEKPRDIILDACAMIRDQLQDGGFSFRKTGPVLKRVTGDLTCTISFQSDANNIAGRRAAVWIHGAIASRKLAALFGCASGNASSPNSISPD